MPSVIITPPIITMPPVIIMPPIITIPPITIPPVIIIPPVISALRHATPCALFLVRWQVCAPHLPFPLSGFASSSLPSHPLLSFPSSLLPHSYPFSVRKDEHMNEITSIHLLVTRQRQVRWRPRLPMALGLERKWFISRHMTQYFGGVMWPTFLNQLGSISFLVEVCHPDRTLLIAAFNETILIWISLLIVAFYETILI